MAGLRSTVQRDLRRLVIILGNVGWLADRSQVGGSVHEFEFFTILFCSSEYFSIKIKKICFVDRI